MRRVRVCPDKHWRCEFTSTDDPEIWIGSCGGQYHFKAPKKRKPKPKLVIKNGQLVQETKNNNRMELE